jgi:type I restriction and modification enzyme subunit R-like protein
MAGFTGSVVEDAALAWQKALRYQVLHGPEIAVGEPGAERSDAGYRDVVLESRLRHAQPAHVCEGQHTRRPDVVLLVNGLPLAVIELSVPEMVRVTGAQG